MKLMFLLLEIVYLNNLVRSVSNFYLCFKLNKRNKKYAKISRSICL